MARGFDTRARPKSCDIGSLVLLAVCVSHTRGHVQHTGTDLEGGACPAPPKFRNSFVTRARTPGLPPAPPSPSFLSDVPQRRAKRIVWEGGAGGRVSLPPLEGGRRGGHPPANLHIDQESPPLISTTTNVDAGHDQSALIAGRRGKVRVASMMWIVSCSLGNTTKSGFREMEGTVPLLAVNVHCVRLPSVRHVSCSRLSHRQNAASLFNHS